MAAPPRLFDRALHRRRLDRAAGAFSAAGFLRQRVSEDFAWRLTAVKRDFPTAVDLAARDGAFAAALARSPASGKIGLLIESDLSPAMIGARTARAMAADEESLPIAEASVDLVVSALALHWTNDLVGALVQIRRALRPDGLFLGALFGGATLAELRSVLLEAEAALAGGAGPRVSPFLDPYDAPGLLQRAGFADPVVDTDTVVARYDHLLALAADLRAMGETNVLVDRAPAPLSRAVLARAAELYAERFAGPDGRIAATFEIVTLTGWAPVKG
ncbi:MAG: methyltransferase domain-containing protein [Caulobacteraceae bacterium]